MAAITEEIEAWQTTYDVETWEDLEQSLADGDLSSDELHKRYDVITYALVLSSDIEAAREQLIDVADGDVKTHVTFYKHPYTPIKRDTTHHTH